VIWVYGAGSVLLFVLWVVGLVDLARYRRNMETWQTVLWAVLIVVLPVIGLVAYLFWRISRSEAMLDAMSVPRDKRGPDDWGGVNPMQR